MTNLDSIFKSRDITNKDQSYSFPVVMHGCESWTKHRRIHALNCGVGEDS